MENSRSQLLERLQTANNILVTVSSNPSVDQLSAAIGLTLMLNKVGKQGTAVFSGKVPSTIEFLQPEKTIEKNTDSLRDFIIALDKSKADKLRYKVEDNHVKIFITPYRTAISEKDLQFSQGDFNVEVVIALGVKDQKDLDRAITAHGRILHDATTISVTNGEPGTVGAIDWDDPKASSLSEMVASLANDLGPDSLDSQIATSLMTGIVAQTERFRNARTSPATMSIGSALMAAGANQQLIATKLEQAAELPLEVNGGEEQSPELDVPPEPQASDDTNALEISHDEEEPEPMFELPSPEEAPDSEQETPVEQSEAPVDSTPDNDIVGGGSLILDPPTLGGKLSANTEPEHLDPPTDPLSVANDQPPILERQDNQVAAEPATPIQNEPPAASAEPVSEPVPEVAQSELPSVPAQPSEPVVEPPVNPTPEPLVPDVANARDAVSDALASITSTQPQPPIAALNAQPFEINDQLGVDTSTPQPVVDQDFFTVPPTEPSAQPVNTPAMPEMPVPEPAPEMPAEPTTPPAPSFELPENLVPPAQPAVDTTAAPTNAPAAPPVPPPFMPSVPGFDPSVLPPTPPQPSTDNQPPATP